MVVESMNHQARDSCFRICSGAVLEEASMLMLVMERLVRMELTSHSWFLHRLTLPVGAEELANLNLYPVPFELVVMLANALKAQETIAHWFR